MDNYKGTIIEESLDDKAVLKGIRIISTHIENVTDEHQTPWIKQWTLHEVEISSDEARNIANELSKSLDKNHNWYADYKNSTHHYIIFRNKVFYINRHDKEAYNEAKKYGLSLGIPEYQVDFHPDIEEWKH